MPRATSRAIEPLGMISTGVRVSSPSRMTEPLPNCRSICRSAASRALFLSLARSGDAVLPLGAMGNSLSLNASVRLAATLGALRSPLLSLSVTVAFRTRSLSESLAFGVTAFSITVPAVNAAPAANTAHVTRRHRHFRAVPPRSAKRVTNAHGAPTYPTIRERLFEHGQDAPACSIGAGSAAHPRFAAPVARDEPGTLEPAAHFDRLLGKIPDGLV